MPGSQELPLGQECLYFISLLFYWCREGGRTLPPVLRTCKLLILESPKSLKSPEATPLRHKPGTKTSAVHSSPAAGC